MLHAEKWEGLGKRNHVTHVMMMRTESRSIKVNKMSHFYAIRAFYQAESIFSKAFKDRFLIDIDLSQVNCEL